MLHVLVANNRHHMLQQPARSRLSATAGSRIPHAASNCVGISTCGKANIEAAGSRSHASVSAWRSLLRWEQVADCCWAAVGLPLGGCGELPFAHCVACSTARNANMLHPCAASCCCTTHAAAATATAAAVNCCIGRDSPPRGGSLPCGLTASAPAAGVARRAQHGVYARAFWVRARCRQLPGRAGMRSELPRCLVRLAADFVLPREARPAADCMPGPLTSPWRR